MYNSFTYNNLPHNSIYNVTNSVIDTIRRTRPIHLSADNNIITLSTETTYTATIANDDIVHLATNDTAYAYLDESTDITWL